VTPSTAGAGVSRRIDQRRSLLKAEIVACKTVGGELQSFLPDGMRCTLLEFGLHLDPDRLHTALQKQIDDHPPGIDTILLGYGMCSRGTVGLESRDVRLVIPRVDDCIGLFLGSREEYLRQNREAPGTFYLTSGWIECGDDPYREYLSLCAKYGPEKASRIERLYINNYTRLAFIRTGEGDAERHLSYARAQAEFFGLRFEEIRGSRTLLEKLLTGTWDDDFVVVEPGQTVRQEMFID
jgi:hypothetical protein